MGKAKGMRKERVQRTRTKTQLTTQSDRECFHCATKGRIAGQCKKRINDEKTKAGQHRDNLRGNSTSVKQRVAALETSTSKVQVENASSGTVSSLLLTPAQLAATYAQIAGQVAATAPAVQCGSHIARRVARYRQCICSVQDCRS